VIPRELASLLSDQSCARSSVRSAVGSRLLESPIVLRLPKVRFAVASRGSAGVLFGPRGGNKFNHRLNLESQFRAAEAVIP